MTRQPPGRDRILTQNPMAGSTPQNLDWVAATLVEAFRDDPVATYLFPDPAARAVGMEHIFKMAIRSASKLGVIETPCGQEAAAIWLRPGNAALSWMQMIRAGALATPFVVGWRAAGRMMRYEAFVEKCREGQMGRRPYWYLFAIGVRPEGQGQGLGSGLIQRGWERAQASRVSCYLETSHEPNLTFYRRNGFAVTAEHRMPFSELTVWSLVREPGPIRNELENIASDA